MSDVVKRLKEANARMNSEVSNWNSIWQVVGEFVTQRKMNFEQTLDAGEFLNEDIFDSTATFASKNASSALQGMMWSATAKKSVSVIPPEDMEDITKEEQHWYDNVASKRFQLALDNPKANLGLVLDEYMQDQVDFGTSGIGVFWEDDDLLFKPFSVKETRIDEGKNSRIDFIILNYEWTVKRFVDTYDIENVSQKVRDMYNNGNLDGKVKLLIAYEENKEQEDGEDFPYKSYHIEVETDHIAKEGGFDEFPILMARFRKLIYEKHGRSMAMDALPDIRELNILSESVIVATEKMLDPPLGLLSNSAIGNQIVDTSSGALNVVDPAGNSGNPIFPINTVGDISVVYKRIEDLKQSIAQHFFIDRLLDFNNNVAMTARETTERASIRDNSLSSLISRQNAEMYTPLMERSFNVLLRNNRFGYIEGTKEFTVESQFGEVDLIPERIAQRLLDGEDAYQIKFNTPASRIASAEELEGMLNYINMTQALAQTNPIAVKYLNVEEIQKNGIELMGAPAETIRTKEEVDAELEAEQELIAQQDKLNQAEQVAGIASDLAPKGEPSE